MKGKQYQGLINCLKLKHLKKIICNPLFYDISYEECLIKLHNKTLNEYMKITHICKYCDKSFDRKSRLENHNLKCNKRTKEIELLEQKLNNANNKITNLLNNNQTNDREYIYLLHEREFIKSSENVFKLGKTKNFKSRMGGYPKGSELIHVQLCKNIDEVEKELLELFKDQFVHRKDVGLEYFEGNEYEMVNKIINKFNI